MQVHGKRFVYKFVCDLKQLLGYSAGELNRLVEDSAHKELQKVRENIRPGQSCFNHASSLLTVNNFYFIIWHLCTVPYRSKIQF